MKKNFIKLNQKCIDNIFEEVGCTDNEIVSALLRLYKFALPNFKSNTRLEGFPIVSRKTAEYIMMKMQLMSGDGFAANFLWLNNGFSFSKEMPDWIVDVSKVKIVTE
ncbi:MAG: hypothetical protein K0B15_11875 [Lentimicrobium sp.]|nr:hypothetical protein [Lentimicrobium sp.]